MAIVDRHIQTSGDNLGLGENVLNLVLPIAVYPAASSGGSKMWSTAGMASAATINATRATGTVGPDVPRNLVYGLVPASSDTAFISGGTLVAVGSDIKGNAVTETIALTSLQAAATASLAQVHGTQIFAAKGLSYLSLSNFSFNTSVSSASSNGSLGVGYGNIVGLPIQIRSTNAILDVHWGTSQFTGAQYTVQTGSVGVAGLSVSTTLTTASTLVVLAHLRGEKISPTQSYVY